jgi:hypothetical protein
VHGASIGGGSGGGVGGFHELAMLLRGRGLRQHAVRLAEVSQNG